MFIKRSNKQLIKSLSQTLTNSIDDLSNNISSTLSQISYVVDAEGEKDGDTIVFATGMGAPMEDASGNVSALGLLVPTSGFLTKVFIAAKGYTSLNDPLTFEVKVYDASGSTDLSSIDITLNDSKSIVTTSMELDPSGSQLIIKLKDTTDNTNNLVNWGNDSRFRVGFVIKPTDTFNGGASGGNQVSLNMEITSTTPLNINNDVLSVLLDTTPTLDSTNLINSGNIKNVIDTKQDILTTSSNIHINNLDLNGDLSVNQVFVTNSQSNVSNSLTRKDYVDTQVGTKQDTLITSSNLNVNNIDCEELEASNLKLYDIGTSLALLAHKSMASSTGYTLGITNGGDTTLNVNSSGNLKFSKNGNTDIAKMNSTGIVIESGRDLYRGSTSLTTDLATKQDTLTASYGVKIDGTTIKADNRTIVIDDLADVYLTASVVIDYLTGLGYTLTDFNNVISPQPYSLRNGFRYPLLYGSQSLNGKMEKTLPNYYGQLEINYGNGNLNNGFVKIYLDNVLQDTATQTEQDKTLVVDFTPEQVLKIEETNFGAVLLYHIITRQRLAIPVARTRLSQISYYTSNIDDSFEFSNIINFYPSTYNYILNDLGIVFTTQSDTNASTGWLLPTGTYKIHYKYSFDNGTYNNRLGIRAIASMSNITTDDYQASVGYSYGHGRYEVDKQTVQADFIYVASSATYMRIRLNCAKDNSTYDSNWNKTSILEGSSVIIEKID